MIEKYLRGELQEKDKRIFESRLNTDSNLQEKFISKKEDFLLEDLLFISEAKRILKKQTH